MVKKPLHIAASPLSDCVSNVGLWVSGKQKVTLDILVAVVEHTLKSDKPIVISRIDGTPEFRITVEKL